MITIHELDKSSEQEIPLFSGISTGFPSPAMDFDNSKIDLNKELIKHPESTYFGRVNGFSMKNVGIDDGDLLIIDKSIVPRNGLIAVCFLDGEFTAKRILKENNQLILMPENEDYRPILVAEVNNFIVWGIVTHVIKSF